MSTVIIDYGMSNLGSIRQAVQECGGDGVVITKPDELAAATHIIMPGVGAFKDGMHNLRSAGWIDPLRDAVFKDKVPFLGICLGMQLMAEKGYEGGESTGLGFIKGAVKRLESSSPEERIPHVGWNEVYTQGDSPLFQGIPEGTDFYFVHSYHFVPENKDAVMATTPYCGQFVSGVRDKNIFGVQFHPEKSQRPGFSLLKNFLNL